MPLRNRVLYAVFAALVIACGLATRPLRTVINPEITDKLGDTLWAMLVYLLIAWTWRRASSARVAFAAAAFAAAVEFSQLYEAPWLTDIRRTTLGSLTLGSGFDWGDLVAYAIGIFLCFGAEFFVRRPNGTKS